MNDPCEDCDARPYTKPMYNGEKLCGECKLARKRSEHDAMSPRDKLLDSLAWSVADGWRMSEHDLEARVLLVEVLDWLRDDGLAGYGVSNAINVLIKDLTEGTE